MLKNRLIKICNGMGSCVLCVKNTNSGCGPNEICHEQASGQEQVKQLDRRLELQAGVIRTLHNAMHAREERLERLMGAFQGLHALATDSPASARRPSLPEEM